MQSRSFAALACTAVAVAVGAAAVDERRAPPGQAEVPDEVARIDALLEARWREEGVQPEAPASDLLLLRRLSLALFGQSPSLEEVRRFEADAAPGRLARWATAMTKDPRFSRYWAERLSRAWVGANQGPFLVFRRDRFNAWLAGELEKNTPYDALVRQVVAQEGTWTGEPATNFVTAALVNQQVDADKLAGRTMRVFAGQRLECAQCHDHPFAPWTQKQFEGLRSFYASAKVSALGVTHREAAHGAVPYGEAWLSSTGTPREQLARWLTDPRNPQLGRAAANRVWALLYGRPLHEPLDDLPPEGSEPLLDELGRDFTVHGYDLRRLVLTAALARSFGLGSRELLPEEKNVWAAFPVTPLRPEQVVGALLQAGSVRTVDRDRHALVRAVRLLREKAFVDEYGDPGEDELTPQADTVARALFRMNGKLPDDVLKAGPFSTTGRVANLAKDDGAAVDALFLAYLSRLPSADEREQLRPLLQASPGDARGQALADVAWGLFNSAEFTWNH